MAFIQSLRTGLLLSVGLSLFFRVAISITYMYLSESILIVLGLIIICSLIQWISMHYDQASDVIGVFSRTVSFDLEHAQPNYFRVLHVLRSLNPYAGFLGAVLALLFSLVIIPAVILYWAVHPGQPATSFHLYIFFMSVVISTFYYLSGKDKINSFLERVLFFTGVLLGTAGVVITFSEL